MTLTLLPLSFYAAVLLIGLGVSGCLAGLRQGWGVPAIVVLITIATWYVGDVFYNNYEEYFWQFGTETLDNAWWQVVLFLITFLVLVKPVHDAVNRKLQDRDSFAVRSYEGKLLDDSSVQHQIDRLFALLLGVWVVLNLIGLSRVQWDFMGLFFPYLAGHSAEPWGRGRIGGQFDALISFAIYLQIFLTASFGLVLAVSRNSRTQSLAAVCFCLSAPYYLLGRTRNTMLAVLTPGLLAWVALRLRAGWLGKMAALVVAFSVVNFWMLLVMANRSQQVENLAAAMLREDAFETVESAAHEGLNMFEELAWVGQLTKQGLYQPNWGARYWAEVVNPIPRGLWSGKPEIGLDYAAARGMAEGGESAENRKEGGVAATISTGMIGQGVVNFGPILGPMFAALLMVLWVALLARQDLMASDHPTRFLLYALGIILTFNMGRDITFIVTYPFFFGYVFVYWMEKRRERPRGASVATGNESTKSNEAVLRPNNGARGGESRVASNGGGPIDERRDVGTGGTVRTLPSRTPKRVARWMPRRMRQLVVSEQRAAEESQESEAGERKSEAREKPRQLAVPYQNYRRYRG